MDSFEINKIIAAVILTALIIIGIDKFANILFHVDKPQQSAYKIEGLETLTSTASENMSNSQKEIEKVDIAQLLSLGDAVHG